MLPKWLYICSACCSITQRIKMIKTYYKSYASATATCRALGEDYGLHNRPTSQPIVKTVKKFEETGSGYKYSKVCASSYRSLR